MDIATLQQRLRDLERENEQLRARLVAAEQSEQQAETLQLNRFTVENAADAIGWYELSGKVLYFNKAAFALYGYPPEALEHLT